MRFIALTKSHNEGAILINASEIRSIESIAIGHGKGCLVTYRDGKDRTVDEDIDSLARLLCEERQQK